MFKLPFKQDSFDLIYSMGVLHHTSNTEKAFAALVPFLANQGTIAIWVYPDQPDLAQRLSDRIRTFTTRMNPRLLYKLSWVAVPAYFVRKIPLLGTMLFHFLPPISMEPYWEDRVLDTFQLVLSNLPMEAYLFRSLRLVSKGGFDRHRGSERSRIHLRHESALVHNSKC